MVNRFICIAFIVVTADFKTNSCRYLHIEQYDIKSTVTEVGDDWNERFLVVSCKGWHAAVHIKIIDEPAAFTSSVVLKISSVGSVVVRDLPDIRISAI
jgi:hypothetical protein